MSLISIIIPVYNNSKSLKRCLESVVNQTYKDLEIIIVNDGSTDNSLDICNEFAKKDDRIVIIDKENGGVSSARNAGLKVANGEYIGFVDGDDTINEKMYEILLDNLIGYDADVSICSFIFKFQDNSEKHYFNNKDKTIKILNNKQAIIEALKGRLFAGHLCNKLFKTKIINNLLLDEDIYVYEDLLLCIKAFEGSKSVVFDPLPLYNYYIHDESAYNRLFNKKQLTANLACDRIIVFLKASYPKAVKYVLANCLLYNLNLLWKIRDYSLDDKEIIERQIINRMRYCLKFSTIFNIKIYQTILIISALLNVELFYFLKKQINLIKKGFCLV